MLDKTAPAFMLAMFKVFPLCLDINIIFQIGIGFYPGNSMFVQCYVDTMHDGSINSFTTII